MEIKFDPFSDKDSFELQGKHIKGDLISEVLEVTSTDFPVHHVEKCITQSFDTGDSIIHNKITARHC